MKTQFDTTHNTTFITLDDVRVPAKNLIGRVGHGFRMIVRSASIISHQISLCITHYHHRMLLRPQVQNFNHERFIIACSTCRMARVAYEESIKYAMVRRTFGKRLVDHQIIRHKLAEMASKIQRLYANLERVAFQFSKGVEDKDMGAQCALLKVQCSQTFEFCAREASQIFGGSSIVREGRGKLVERLYREVRATAIPGGSEEILMDFAVRSAIAEASRL